ncbi:MAG TPA: FAD-dependent oxidoreductase [Lichenihabitans sp.]|jgi:NADPH-dependent 2,4-dienoyl-CoA reductase/sulfur reductase-like enzyme/nitrite reductase/ring-hydroxylating ferredoxin subunit|nr:FAD-dependent oxidoreductase [Lichenihabitans sp.]
MSNDDAKALPDLAAGLALSDIPEGQIVEARAGDEKILLWRQGDGVRAFEGSCTHLGAPLAEGLVIDGTIRCPWHHACFSLRSGEALAAPAFAPLRQWPVALAGGQLTLAGPPRAPTRTIPKPGDAAPRTIVIVGGGAGGFAAADRLRRDGYAGSLTVVSDDVDAPYDRTLLTKDYLAGTTGEDGLGISPVTLHDLGVDLRLGTTVERIERDAKRVVLADGGALPYDRLLLATGAAPKPFDVPGGDLPHVRLLRSAADARHLLEALGDAKTVVVVGGSFIATEAAASLRDRKLEVHLVSPDPHPLEKVLGRALSDLVVDTHRDHGFVLHLGRSVSAVRGRKARLDDGLEIDCDLVLAGLGVTPRTAVAEAAGLAVDDGILVDRQLRTGDASIYAIGDAARWPDPRSGRSVRIEHWAVAERQGQVAAANMLGRGFGFDVVPFFWTKQFDVSIRYVGHAETPDSIVIDGDVANRDAAVRYLSGDRVMAVATLGRDRESLSIESDMEAMLRAGTSAAPPR